MSSVVDQIDLKLLYSAPPRRLPPATILSLVGQRVAGVSRRILLDPLLILGFVGVLVLVLLGTASGVALLLLGLGLRTWVRWRSLIRALFDDIALLRHGQVVRAYVLKAQAGQTLSGNPHGMYLDCAIPLGPRRTHIGSVWIAEVSAGMELARRGRVQVLCLPGPPGSWRLLEGGYSETRSSGGLSLQQRDLIRE